MKNKIKIMKSREQVTDEEIHDFMDFDKLLIEKNKLIRRRNMRMLGKSGIALLVLITGISFYFYNIPAEQESVTQNEEKKSSQQLAARQQIDSIQINTDRTSITNSGVTVRPKVKERNTSAVKNKSAGINALDRKPVEVVYIQAEPVNGYPDLYAYFEKELVYPIEAIKDSIQGDVTVVFSIDTVGKPQQIQIENSLGKPFDKEVLRLITNMPLWKPASFNGKYVNSKVSLPIIFEVKKVHTKN
jgi:TonB family protein